MNEVNAYGSKFGIPSGETIIIQTDNTGETRLYFASGEPVKRIKTRSEDSLTFFLGRSPSLHKLYYCRVQVNDNADLLTELSRKRKDDKDALKLVLNNASAEVWLVSRTVGTRIPETWFTPLSPTD